MEDSHIRSESRGGLHTREQVGGGMLTDVERHKKQNVPVYCPRHF